MYNDSSAWIAILILSDRWQFEQLRQLAISRLEGCKLDPMKKLDLRGRFSLSDPWARAELDYMAERRKPLTLEEAERLDTKTIVEIARIRERWYMDTPNSVHKRRRCW